MKEAIGYIVSFLDIDIDDIELTKIQSKFAGVLYL